MRAVFIYTALMFKILSICKGGGYRYCRTDPPHPKRNAKGLYPLHIVLMENKLGRLLVKGEEVHHKDHNKENDNIENLELTTKASHARYHKLEKAKPNVELTCAICNKVFTLKPYTAKTRMGRNKNGRVFCGRSCSGKGSHIK